jgi:hypothetical protein
MIAEIGQGNVVSQGVHTIRSTGAIALTFWAQLNCAIALQIVLSHLNHANPSLDANDRGFKLK